MPIRVDEVEHASTRVFQGRYEITGLIEKGGMGIVYAAHDLVMGRPVAIKVPRNDVDITRDQLEAFRREARVTSGLSHPSTIRVFERGETPDGRPYMVLELLRGESIRARIDREGPVDEFTALRWVRQVAEALVEAHEAGIVHCDLKPANVLVERIGVTDVVKVFDFGIAQTPRMRASKTFEADGARIIDTWLPDAEESSETVVGTPEYMSPEQCRSDQLDARSDIYALGCLLFTMVEGRPPFEGKTATSVMLDHMRGPVPWATRCGRRVAGLIRQTMRKDPEQRIDSAERFIRRLDECLDALRSAGHRRAPAV